MNKLIDANTKQILREATNDEMIAVFEQRCQDNWGNIIVEIDGVETECDVVSEIDMDWHTERLLEDEVSVNDGVLTYYSAFDLDLRTVERIMADFEESYDHNGEEGEVHATLTILATGETHEWSFSPVSEDETEDDETEVEDGFYGTYEETYYVRPDGLIYCVQSPDLWKGQPGLADGLPAGAVRLRDQVCADLEIPEWVFGDTN